MSKHQIPDFNESIKIAIGTSRRTTRYTFPVVPKYFRTRATRASVAHGPEIVIVPQTCDTFGIEANVVHPDIFSFIITGMHCDPEPFFRQLDDFCQKLPSKFNRLFFEIIAKTKITKHFKKSVVSRGITHVIEIIVFTTSANTTLAACGSRIASIFSEGERFLKLDHARICKQ